MKKIYRVILVFGFLLSHHAIFAQCSVSISASQNTTQLDCKHTSITLTAVPVASSSVTYSWSRNNGGTIGTNKSITVTDSGTYIVKITGTGCIASSSIYIIKNTAVPMVGAFAFPDRICSGDTSTLIAIGADTYQWQLNPPEDESVILVAPKKTLYYTVIGTDANGCTDTSDVKLTVNPLPNASISADSIGCQYNNIEPKVTFKGMGGSQPYTFAYNIDGRDTQTITKNRNDSVMISASTIDTGSFIYHLTSVTDGNGCKQIQSGSAKVTISPVPDFINPTTKSICDNTSVDYTAKSSAEGIKFSWKRAAVTGIKNGPSSDTTARITEILDDTTSHPVDVEYLFTLSTGTGCDKTYTLTVTVNPTPVIDTINSPLYCNEFYVNDGIHFYSSSPDPSFTWTVTNNKDVGFGLGPKEGIIPPFLTKNSTTGNFSATVRVSVTAGSNNCPGLQQSSFTVVVRPTPHLSSHKDTSVCSNAPFIYLAKSSVTGGIKTKYNWTRVAGPKITATGPGTGTTDTIENTLVNNDSIPAVVTYAFNLSVQGATRNVFCTKMDTLRVTVYPTPKINEISIANAYCNEQSVSGILFSSSSPDSSFIWASTQNIGFGTRDTGSIPPFIAINNDTTSFTDTIRVQATVNNNKCLGTDALFMVTLNPAPDLKNGNDTSICSNSLFAYTAKSSLAGTKFSWTRITDSIIRATGPSIDTTDKIEDTLVNKGSIPGVVTYFFKLTATGSDCSKTDSLRVTVNPTPKIDLISSPMIFCNGEFVKNGIPFNSPSPNASFTWVPKINIGFDTSRSGSIHPFVATNTDTVPVFDTVIVIVTDSITKCSALQPSVFAITVNPTPNLISSKGAGICNNVLFAYEAISSVAGTSFSWTRAAVPHIMNAPHIIPVQSDSIHETLISDTSQPVVVTYVFTLTAASNGCPKTDSLKVTVYPTPAIDSISSPKILCNGDFVKDGGIHFYSSSANASFLWTSSASVGFGTNGKDSVIGGFNAINTGMAPVYDTVAVYITDSSSKCSAPAPSTSVITVNPSPQKPGFTSFSNIPDSITLTLCKSSENINFNVTSPQPDSSGISYHWTSADVSNVDIKDTSHPNTVITFNDPGMNTITVTANYKNATCASSASQVVTITDKTSGISLSKEKKIFRKQPGNLLIYPDNSLDGYQWGYNTVSFTPDTASGKPITVPGQVYQFYIPDSLSCHCITSNDSLKIDSFYYWVFLHNNGCDTRIYYNGPYDDKPDSIRLPNPDNSVQLQVIPNPNKGIFKIGLKGNIYGNIEATIYNAAGQIVYRQHFVKTSSDINETFITNGLPPGVYFLILRSSDLKQVRSRFIISH